MIKGRDRQKSLEEKWQPNRRKKECMLDEIDSIVNWEPIEKRLNKMYSQGAGRPAISPLGMFKLLLLEIFYELSDVRVVEELHDRRSFERFCGIDLLEHKVDDSSLVRFRERLREGRLTERLLGIFNKQIDAKGLIIRKGTLVDSTLVKGAHRPGAVGKDGETLDEDVDWTVRKGQAEHGMKVSISVDEGSEIVRHVVLTPASTSDMELLCDLVLRDEAKVYGDKGYASWLNREFLTALGIRDGILHKAARGRPLTKSQIQVNKQNSRIRANIERKFAEAKERHGMGRLRYRGIDRNFVQIVMTMVAVNLKRFVRLAKTAPPSICKA